jgi:hypothetical protein
MLAISMFLMFFTSSVQADFDHFGLRSDMSYNDINICNIYKAEIISEVEFYKARFFLANLIKKYPKEFHEVSFYMVRNPYPFTGYGIIGIPYEWLVMLENEISVAEKWMEWALLHEAGHIHHQHVKILSLFVEVQSFLKQCLAMALCASIGGSFISDSDFTKLYGKDIQQKHLYFAAGFFATSAFICSIASILYSKHVAEPEADDFAAEKCQNKKALEAGAVWLDKCTLDNSLYPSVEDRIAKINTAIEKRFTR